MPGELGEDELRASRRHDKTPLFTRTGELYMHLDHGFSEGEMWRGDFDGDGRGDMALEQQTAAESIAMLRPVGTRLTIFMTDAWLFSPFIGDIDGDGMEEFINREGPELAAYGYQQERVEYEGFPPQNMPSAMHDFDGDGIGEVVAFHSGMAAPEYFDPEKQRFKGPPLTEANGEEEWNAWLEDKMPAVGGVYNFATKQFSRIAPGETNWRMNILRGSENEIAFIDIDSDGQDEFIGKAPVGTMLMAFNADGSLAYHEEFGEAVTDMQVAHCRGDNYLIVQTESAVLVWP